MVIQWADVGWLMRIHSPDVGSRMTIGGTDIVPPMLIRKPDVG